MSERLSSELTLSNVKQVILVLGKRLVNSRLSAEGRSRVDALASFATRFDFSESAVAFCGGTLAGQKMSEAQAMAQRFDTHFPSLALSIPPAHIILEDRSRNTVENIENAAHQLITAGLCSTHQTVDFSLVSNDYHLARIIEIQKMMPEQGLLSTLEQRCQKAGLAVSISLEQSKHCSVRYPHVGEQAQAFLLLDELTNYRVYLEGVVAGVFTRPLERVRAQPHRIAEQAMLQLFALDCCQRYRAQLSRLSAIITQSSTERSAALIKPLLLEFHPLLTQLNRQFDPENEQPAMV